MTLLKAASIVAIFYLNILILCSQVGPAFSDLPIHGQKNSTLLRQILNIESDNQVPEYEIVQLQILPKRSSDEQNVMRVHLSAFGKDIHLRLERNDDFGNRSRNIKFSKGSLTDNGMKLTEVYVKDDDLGIPYIDLVQMAAVTIRYGPDGKLLMDGVIGNDIIIKPVPTDIYPGDYIVYNRDFSDESNSYEYSTSSPIKGSHIVYRSAMNLKSAFKVVGDDVLKTIHSADDRHGQKRHLHAFPEVLLMVDSDSYAMHVSHGYNDAQIMRYYVSFMNGVDLRFKILSDPKISLILSQIVIFKTRDGTPFLKKNLFWNANKVMDVFAYRDFALHMYSHRESYPDIDVAVLLTRLDLCSPRHVFYCNTEVIGISYRMGACGLSHAAKAWTAVAIVEDNGGFDGTLAAAHEIGHLLGSHHDGSKVQELPDHFSNCSAEDGYIMTPKMVSSRLLQWSECSIKQFRYFLSSHNASCLFNQPNYRNELDGSELPGVVLSLDEQCKRILGTKANAWDSRVCGRLHCDEPAQNVTPKRKVVIPPAAEGSSCGQNLHCRNKICVPKYRTYSQTSSTSSVHDSWKYIDSTTVSTTTELPSTTVLPSTKGEKDCTEEKENKFCKIYSWFIGQKEACSRGLMLEYCCYSHRTFCKV